MILEDFAAWMKENTSLAESSIYKYSRAVNTISNDMNELGVLSEGLLGMSLIKLDIAIQLILRNPEFISKNKTGNNMYSNALKQFRLFRNIETSDELSSNDAKAIISGFDSMKETERTALIKSRVGQGLFRKQLLEKYNNSCIITGINETKLLIASHIKPWAVSTNEERLSSENGLLLSPTFDKLFDCGLISFADTGKIIISSQLSKDVVGKLHISEDDVFPLKASSELKQNLEYHRDVVFTTHIKNKTFFTLN